MQSLVAQLLISHLNFEPDAPDSALGSDLQDLEDSCEVFSLLANHLPSNLVLARVVVSMATFEYVSHFEDGTELVTRCLSELAASGPAQSAVVRFVITCLSSSRMISGMSFDGLLDDDNMPVLPEHMPAVEGWAEDALYELFPEG